MGVVYFHALRTRSTIRSEASLAMIEALRATELRGATGAPAWGLRLVTRAYLEVHGTS